MANSGIGPPRQAVRQTIPAVQLRQPSLPRIDLIRGCLADTQSQRPGWLLPLNAPSAAHAHWAQVARRRHTPCPAPFPSGLVLLHPHQFALLAFETVSCTSSLECAAGSCVRGLRAPFGGLPRPAGQRQLVAGLHPHPVVGGAPAKFLQRQRDVRRHARLPVQHAPVAGDANAPLTRTVALQRMRPEALRVGASRMRFLLQTEQDAPEPRTNPAGSRTRLLCSCNARSPVCRIHLTPP